MCVENFVKFASFSPQQSMYMYQHIYIYISSQYISNKIFPLKQLMLSLSVCSCYSGGKNVEFRIHSESPMQHHFHLSSQISRETKGFCEREMKLKIISTHIAEREREKERMKILCILKGEMEHASIVC